MSVPTYPATPYLQQLAANGWRGRLVRDRHGRADLIVAVQVGLTWTDSVAIEAEDRCVALRHRTHEGRLTLPTRCCHGTVVSVSARGRSRVSIPSRPTAAAATRKAPAKMPSGRTSEVASSAPPTSGASVPATRVSPLA
jgi:hypothetical protein